MPRVGLRRKFTNNDDDDVDWVPPQKRRKVTLIVLSSDDESESDISDKDSDDYNSSESEDDSNFIDNSDEDIDDDSSSDSEDSDDDSESDSDSDDDDETFDDNIREYTDMLEDVMNNDDRQILKHITIGNKQGKYIPKKLSELILYSCETGEDLETKSCKYAANVKRTCFSCKIKRTITFIISDKNNKKYELGCHCHSRIELAQIIAKIIYEYKKKNDASKKASKNLKKEIEYQLLKWSDNEQNIKKKSDEYKTYKKY
jgi:hypothetical protein